MIGGKSFLSVLDYNLQSVIVESTLE